MALKGLRIWNYNNNSEDRLCCGVKHCRMTLNNSTEIPLRVVRKAIGDASFEYGQFLPFSTDAPQSPSVGAGEPARKISFQEPFVKAQTSSVCEVVQQYVTPVNPNGMVIKIVIITTWGDTDYVGLNGLQMFDASGKIVTIKQNQLQAVPLRDINDLPEVRNRGHDARCLENLIHPTNDTFNDTFMWLCPNSFEANGQSGICSILLLFDEPLTISLVKLWNYSKTPTR
jgi:protein JBTS26